MSQTLRWKWLCVRHLSSEPSDRERFSLSIIRPCQQSGAMNTKCSSKRKKHQTSNVAQCFFAGMQKDVLVTLTFKTEQRFVQNRIMVHVTVKVILVATESYVVKPNFCSGVCRPPQRKLHPANTASSSTTIPPTCDPAILKMAHAELGSHDFQDEMRIAKEWCSAMKCEN